MLQLSLLTVLLTLFLLLLTRFSVIVILLLLHVVYDMCIVLAATTAAVVTFVLAITDLVVWAKSLDKNTGLDVGESPGKVGVDLICDLSRLVVREDICPGHPFSKSGVFSATVKDCVCNVRVASEGLHNFRDRIVCW